MRPRSITAAQVIHDYGDVCQAITDLAIELDAPITADEFRTLNRCLDEAMAEAVSEFGRLRELSMSEDETERLGFFAHELRNLLHNAMLAFEVLKGGSVGVGGSTGTVLGRNLTRMRNLTCRRGSRSWSIARSSRRRSRTCCRTPSSSRARRVMSS